MTDRTFRPLCERTNIINLDVAKAISDLVGSDSTLPIAIGMDSIVERLVELAHIDEDGVSSHITAMARRTMGDQFQNRLLNTAVFYSGYKRYEKESRFPVVPVTSYFFKIVYGDAARAQGADTLDMLDAMTDVDIKQSLPKRSGYAKAMNANGEYDRLRDEDGAPIYHTGELSGIVVFPNGSNCGLLVAWLGRIRGTTVGLANAVVDKIEHARPEETESVARLREHMGQLKPLLQRALPRPPRR